MYSNRKLHEIAAYLNLVTPPTDDADNVYSSELLLELLVFTAVSVVIFTTQFTVCAIFLLFCVMLCLLCKLCAILFLPRTLCACISSNLCSSVCLITL